MKNIIIYFCFVTIFLVSIPNLLKAQSQDQPARDSKAMLTKAASKGVEITDDSRKASYVISHRDLLNHNKSSILETLDTLNYPLEGTKTYYKADSGGYVTGNNIYGDLAKANYFEFCQYGYLNGILFDFAHATGGNPSIEIAIWDNSGPNNSPGIVKATTSINLNTIKNDISNQQMTYIPFDPPVLLTTSFYAGVVLPTSAGDTLVIWSNTDGDTNPGIAWEKWSTGAWCPISSNQSWSRDIALAIFPVIDYNLSLEANFIASSVNIPIGQSIRFQDISTGNPSTYGWSFEGGTPAISSEQNPVVTYNESGTFNVVLTVENDTALNTRSISDYITVGATSMEINTLNYPLVGEYIVYVTNQNGFVTGNNEYGDLAKANFFFNDQNLFITGILMEFAYATGGNPCVEFSIWDNTGTNGSPGAKIGSQYLALNTIKNDITNEQLTYATLNTPINVLSSFYAGFILPTTAGDTLVVWSNTDGDTDPSTAWELWESNQWYSFTHPDSWGLNIALAVFPVVQNTLGIDENNMEDVIKVFPNPSNGFFSVVSEMFNDEPVILSIHRIDGTLINTRILRNPELFSVDLRNEPAGIYFVTFETDSKCFIQKLVKR
jgi:PKD repeat protein